MHLVGFTIAIYYNAWPYESQKCNSTCGYECKFSCRYYAAFEGHVISTFSTMCALDSRNVQEAITPIFLTFCSTYNYVSRGTQERAIHYLSLQLVLYVLVLLRKLLTISDLSLQGYVPHKNIPGVLHRPTNAQYKHTHTHFISPYPHTGNTNIGITHLRQPRIHMQPPSEQFPRIRTVKQRDALISQIYFWNETLHTSDSSSVYRQEFITVHTAMVCHTGLLTACEQDRCRQNMYDIYHCCV